MRTEQELRALIAKYRQHKDCGPDDEYETGCPVCADIDQFEHELAMVTGDWSKWGHPPESERECTS